MVYLKTKKDRLLHRIKIIKGHLEKVANMIDKRDYCIDILHQSLAIQKALKQVDTLLMEDHLTSCVVKQIKEGKEKKMVDELLGVYGYKV